jgi:valyl-tRNA synthetase
VIADEYVDRDFGTGALKITPGHDPNDYEIGKKHNLAVVNILNPDATMNEEAGPYAGLDRFECRKKLWQDMADRGLTLRREAYTMQVPRSQRGGEIIEPMISTQWFVKMKSLADPALEAVRDGRIEIIPERFEKVYFNWLENIRDWCISRQLWWGHRIPAWHCGACGELTVALEDPTQCAHCGSQDIEQDPDVLDTWFSSGLWPFSTLGWPDDTEDLRYFYPTTMMETGYDILFFWVARMIMLGLEFTGEVPFAHIYLHGLVRVESGVKMSKSQGNVVDPLSFVENYGADALRFTMLTGSTPGQDSKLDLDRLEANRNFANKLWNAGRLILGSLESVPEGPSGNPSPTLADRWVTTRLSETIRDVDRLFESYQYGEAGRQLYDFFWTEFADWYLEIAKLQLNEGGDRAWLTGRTLVEVYDACLRMLHPFIPFVTEELWGHLRGACSSHPAGFEPEQGWEDALIIAAWPKPGLEAGADEAALESFGKFREVVTTIRNMRVEKQVEAKRKIAALIAAGSDVTALRELEHALCTLAGIDPSRLHISEALEKVPPDAIPAVVRGIEIYLPMQGLFDVEEELERLRSQLDETNAQIERLRELLAGPFADRAPSEVVGKERDRLKAFEETAAKLRSQLEGLPQD